MLTAVSAVIASVVRRTLAFLKSNTGQSETAFGFLRSRRCSSHMPSGISSRPTMNAAGMAMKTTSPAYGLTSQPASTAITSAMNSTADVVVRRAPMIATG